MPAEPATQPALRTWSPSCTAPHTLGNLALRRAPTAPAPRDVTTGGGTAVAPPRAPFDWPPRCHHVAGSWQGALVCVCGYVCVVGFALSFISPSCADAGLAERSRIRRKSPGVAPGGSRMGRMLRAPYIMTRLTGAHVSAETAHAANPGLPISLVLVIAYNENSTVCYSMNYNTVKRTPIIKCTFATRHNIGCYIYRAYL